MIVDAILRMLPTRKTFRFPNHVQLQKKTISPAPPRVGEIVDGCSGGKYRPNISNYGFRRYCIGMNPVTTWVVPSEMVDTLARPSLAFSRFSCVPMGRVPSTVELALPD